MILGVFEEVLANLDEQGEEDFGDDWMDLVTARQISLEASYRILTRPDRQPIDYSEAPTQAAYVFAYGMPRAGFTYERLKQHRQSFGQPLFPSREISVASIGGGPASELVGLLAYLNDPRMGEDVVSVDYKIFDLGEEWENIANLVADCVPDDIDVTISFEQLDLLDRAQAQQATLAGHDLVIFSYVISELCAFKNEMPVEDNIRTMLRTLDGGSFVLYLDSESFPFYSTFNSCRAFVSGLRQLEDIGGNTVFDPGEYEGVFERYCEELDRDPRLDGNIVSKLLKRD
jgi:ribosomal protein RSM22 (predicted rRNA methylase)